MNAHWLPILAALGLATASAADPCPSNMICVAGQACESMTTVSGAREAMFDGGIYASAVYDWGTASCDSYTQLPFWSSSSLTGHVAANEDFVVTGLAPGTPLTIHARARVVANANSPGAALPANHATGWLEEAGAGHVEAVASSESVGPPVTVDQVLALDFPNVAGQVFRLTMGAKSDARSGTSRATVTLTFVDLPPGAAVSTCHSNPPVPAAPVTWGSLKSRYR